MKSLLFFCIIILCVDFLGSRPLNGNKTRRNIPPKSPQQIHIALADKRSSMTVQWITMEPADETPTVEYGFLDKGLFKINPATVEKFDDDGFIRYLHTAEMNDLDPATYYDYRVGSTDHFSKYYRFRTFPATEDFPYNVCVFGDLGVENGVSRVFLEDAVNRGEIDMIIHIGDIAYDLHTDKGAVGDEFMNSMEPIIAKVPYLVIAGNHENDERNFTHYQKRFNMPNDPFNNSQYYSFDLGAVHFMGVSTEYHGFFYDYGHGPVFTQQNWLRKDFEEANSNRKKVPWIINFQHRPFYCSNTNSYECHSFENTLVRKGFEEMPGLEDLYSTYGLDLGFWGHEHSYERFFPINDRKVYNMTPNPYHNAAAPTYIITGAAGCHTPHAEIDPNNPTPGSASASPDYGYTMLHVQNRKSLFIEQISVEDGTPKIIDSFRLSKDEGHHPTPDKRVGRKLHDFPPFVESQTCFEKDPRCIAKRRKRQI